MSFLIMENPVNVPLAQGQWLPASTTTASRGRADTISTGVTSGATRPSSQERFFSVPHLVLVTERSVQTLRGGLPTPTAGLKLLSCDPKGLD